MELYINNIIQDLEVDHKFPKFKIDIAKILQAVIESQQSGNLAIDWASIQDASFSWKEISSLGIQFLEFVEDKGKQLIYLQKTFVQKIKLEERIKSLILLKWKKKTFDLNRIKECIEKLEKNMQSQDGSFLLNPEQKRAILSCIINPFHIISGGPGTGKTTIVAFIIKVLEEMGDLPAVDKIALAAPTGRAAQRLTESIQNSLHYLNSNLASDNSQNSLNTLDDLSNLRGQTLHSLLVVKRSFDGFYYNTYRYLPQRLIFIDETSMVDLNMMLALLEALPPDDREYRFILIGDPNQLPSVEKGAVINDLIENLITHSHLVTHLTQSNRQKKQSNGMISKITTTAEEIIKLGQGQIYPSQELNNNYPLFSFNQSLPTVLQYDHFSKTKNLKEQEEQIVCFDFDINEHTNFRSYLLSHLWNEIFLKQIESITKWNIQSSQSLNSESHLKNFQSELNRFRCLTVYRKGYFGVEGLNAGIENLAMKDLYPKIGSKTKFKWSIQRRHLSGKLYYSGLPILITENDSHRKLFNGDIGLIVPIGESSKSELRAIFAINNQLVSFAIDTLPKHEQAYFLSVHKSQGSEYENILFYLPPEFQDISQEKNLMLMNRQIVYTAITRAKKQVFLACEGNSWNAALQNTLTRITGFKL